MALLQMAEPLPGIRRTASADASGARRPGTETGLLSDSESEQAGRPTVESAAPRRLFHFRAFGFHSPSGILPLVDIGKDRRYL